MSQAIDATPTFREMKELVTVQHLEGKPTVLRRDGLLFPAISS